MIRIALKNPYLVLVVVLMVAVIGAISMARIPADLLPTYKTSAVQIVTFYPGMPPEVMEGDIMSRMQRWTGQSSGIEHQEGKAMQGVCIVKDFFHPNISSSEALAQVSMYAMSDMFYLPPGTIPPMVMPFDPTASVPLCLVSVANPDMNDADTVRHRLQKPEKQSAVDLGRDRSRGQRRSAAADSGLCRSGKAAGL